MSKLLGIVERAAAVALEAGAGSARVKLSRTRDTGVEWRDGKLDRLTDTVSQRLTLALYVDGRFTAQATSDLREDALRAFVERAVAAARHLAPDPHRALPEPARYAGICLRDLELADPGADAVTPESRLAVARALEEAARAGEDRARIVSVSAGCSDSHLELAIVNTNGFEAEDQRTVFGLDVSVSVSADDGRRPSGDSWAVTRLRSDLPPGERLAADARERALAQLGSRQVATGTYDVVVENRAAPQLTRHLFEPLAASALQQRRSFFEGRLGTPCGSEALTVTDDPLLPRGLGSQRWDSEGIVSSARPVFERGVLASCYVDTYYGSKLGLAPTSGDTTNLVWQAGTRDAAAMLAELREGLFVTSFIGGNSSAATGDFSLGIKGFYVKDGRLVHPVSEMNLAGNHLSFWRTLVEVGGDPWPYAGSRTPTLRFSGVSCSGA